MVKGTAGPGEIRRWNQWMEATDQNRAIAKEAIAEIAGFGFDDPGEVDVQAEWIRLHGSTVGKKGGAFRSVRSRTSSVSWILRVASILIVGGMIGFGLFFYGQDDSSSTRVEQITQERTVRTDQGEHKTIKFSNGSRIIVNSNSALTYRLGLLHNQTIEVVLEGEAYFDAESDSSRKEPMFAIHTPDGDIRDIGTEFLVTVSEDYSRVVLQEGEVQINPGGKGNDEPAVALKKGEMLAFDESEVISRKTVNATFYTSWATGFMQFDETTIQEFAQYVEQRFRVQVQLTDPRLTDIKIDGGVYFRSLEELVRSVSEVALIPVYQSADRETVYIGDNF
ncbi:FecR family protein [Fodinibius sediminis]|nr:FecR domain-containing protein [Fodinibius sediminis]